MSTVILAEKPDQARAYMKGLGISFKGKAATGTGETFLDPQTTVVSAAGHLIDLAEPEKYDPVYKDRSNMDHLPLMPPTFKYELNEDQAWRFYQIKKAVDPADRVIVATDKDDEGGAIAYNILLLARALKYKKIARAYPSALNTAAVQRQFKHLEPIEPTWRQAKAAIARSRSDWLIGVNLSRLYTNKLRGIGISGNFAIGRAISTTLNLICQWNQSIIDFKPQPTYELQGRTKINNTVLPLSSNLKVVGDSHNNPKEEYIKALKENGLTQKHIMGVVALVESENKAVQAPILMTKGDLYQEMARVAGWTQSRSKKTMQLNYEQGFQTYPRTDSGKITQYMYDYLRNGLAKFAKAIGIKTEIQPYDYSPDQIKKYLTSEKSAGAHMAIIPTEKIMMASNDVTDDQRLMYEVVVRKSLTIVLPPYRYVSNRLGILVSPKLGMKTQNVMVVDQGWKKILLPSKKKRARKESAKREGFDFSKIVKRGDKVPVILNTKSAQTKPLPPLKSIQIYDKGGLMEKAYKYVDDSKYAKILKETKGIGTSATRDQAMASLQDKDYVKVDRRDVITVTPNGWLINWLLKGSQVNSPVLTAKWEEKFLEIAKGKAEMKELIDSTANMVYGEFNHLDDHWDVQTIQDYYAQREDKFNEDASLGFCPKCGTAVIFDKDERHHGKYDAYKCTNKNCDFIIWYHYSNKTISANNVKRLLAGKPTTKLKQIESRTHTFYDAQLQLHLDKMKNKYVLKVYKPIDPDRRHD